MNKLKDLIENRDTRSGALFDYLIQILIILSLLSFAVETLPDLSEKTISILEGFELICIDGNRIQLSGDNDNILQRWLHALEYVIDIATQRGKVQKQRRGQKPPDMLGTSGIEDLAMLVGSAMAVGRMI